MKAGVTMENLETYDLKPARKVYSGIGWSLCAILAVLLVTQVALSLVLKTFWPDGCWLTISPYGKWILNFAPQYLIAIPTGLLLLRRIPGSAPEGVQMDAKTFWTFLPICFCLTYAGSFAGNILSSLLSGGQAENALNEFALDSNPIKILFMVVLAPLFEEYVFRKQIIDRTRVYGEKTAVFLSALTFGLFHANLFQFFYAFMVGWIFAYAYIRSGRLRYPVLMHSIVNLMGSVIAPMIMSMLDLEALSTIDPNATNEEVLALYGSMLPGLLLYMAYLFVTFALSVTGLVFLILNCQKLVWKDSACQLPAGNRVKTAYLNSGMLVFLIATLALTILSVLL